MRTTNWMYPKKVDKYAKLVDKRRQRTEDAYVHKKQSN